MTKAKVLAGLQKCAKKLDRTPTYTELWRMTKITKYMIKLHFGTLAEALKRAGIAARGIGHRLDTLTLLEDWAHLTRKVGRPPSFMEYRTGGQLWRKQFSEPMRSVVAGGRAVLCAGERAQERKSVGGRVEDRERVGRQDNSRRPAQDGASRAERARDAR